MKICIDPGHYGDNYNPGVAAGYVESNFTWAYHLLLKEKLEKYGVEIITTRENKENNPGLQARGRMSKDCDLFISVHSNGVDNNPSANQVVVFPSMVSGGFDVGKFVGTKLTEFFKGEWGEINPLEVYSVESKDKKGFDHYGVLRGAASVGTPAIIVEHSFHSNAKYCEWAMVDGNIERMADAEVAAIVEYYNLSMPFENDIYFIPLMVDLAKGDKGNEVKRMQMRFRQISAEFDEEVKAHSFKDGVPDGSFGGKMVETVKKFQKYAGIPATGNLDVRTRYVLNCDCGIMYGNLQEAEGQISAIRSILA